MGANQRSVKDPTTADAVAAQALPSDFGDQTIEIAPKAREEMEAVVAAMPFAAPAAHSDELPHGTASNAGLPFSGGPPQQPVRTPIREDTRALGTLVQLDAAAAEALTQRIRRPVEPAPPPPPSAPWAQQFKPVDPGPPPPAIPPPTIIPRRAVPPAPPGAVRPPDPLRDAPPGPGRVAAEPEPEPEAQAPLISIEIMADEMLELVWFEPKAVPRIRRQPPWRRILDALDAQPDEPPVDDDALDDDDVEVEDRRDAFEILARGKAQSVAHINDLLRQGRHDAGKFVPPLALFAGTLQFPFDPLEDLKATITTALPFASVDENLTATLKDASAFLQTPNLLSAPEVSRALIKRITDAFRRVDRFVSKSYLEEQKRRVLLESRHYQRCQVFGDEHIRAVLRYSIAEEGEGVPTYLPATLARDLPMFEHFRTRLIATVEPAASQFESHPTALRVVVLGRVSQPPR